VSFQQSHLRIEFSRISPYAKDADEFVRQSCREHAGWRRDEWAHSPLFIWGKSLGFLGQFSGQNPQVNRGPNDRGSQEAVVASWGGDDGSLSLGWLGAG
jgi:hypothetical protein